MYVKQKQYCNKNHLKHDKNKKVGEAKKRNLVCIEKQCGGILHGINTRGSLKHTISLTTNINLMP